MFSVIENKYLCEVTENLFKQKTGESSVILVVLLRNLNCFILLLPQLQYLHYYCWDYISLISFLLFLFSFFSYTGGSFIYTLFISVLNLNLKKVFRMLRGSRICQSLGILKPCLASAVPAEAAVQRFIGLSSARFYNVSLLHSISEKTSGVAKDAADAASAYLSLLSFNPTQAIESINKIQSKISDPTVLRFAIGVRLRARNELLDIKETALTVSCGSSESEVSDIRSLIKEDLQLLKEASPGCWLVQLAEAEFLLYTGKINEALEQFRDVEEKCTEYLSKSIHVTNEVATSKNPDAFSFIGLQLRRLGVLHGNSLDFEDPHVSNTLKQFKSLLELTISDEEATELAYVLEAVHARHHFQEYFPLQEDYDVWNSESAEKAKWLINEFLCPSDISFQENELGSFGNSVSQFSTKTDLTSLLSKVSQNESPVATLRAALGTKAHPSSRTDSFMKAFENIQNSVASYETSGSEEFAKNRNTIAKSLALQLLYRTKVQIGVALIEKERYHDAIDSLSPVINADEYIYMWRAFLARSRAHKALGNITESDRDLKKMKGLKKSVTDRTPYEKS